MPAESAVMLDDMTVNLEPAAAMGMTTVWVRSHYSWSGDEAEDNPHVHHKTNDVTEWLQGVVGPYPPLDSRAALPHKRAHIVMDRNTERSPS